MSEQEKVECGYVDPKTGVKCTEMVGKHHFSKQSHMKKVHGVVPESKAKTEPKAQAKQEPTEPASHPIRVEEMQEFADAEILRLKKRGVAAQKEQLQRLQAKAPNIMFGVSGERSEMDQKTEWAAKAGVFDPNTEAPHWVRHVDMEMAVEEGRDIPLHHGRPVRYGNLVLTTRPKVIADALHNEHQNRLREQYKEFTIEAQQKSKEAAAIVPELAAAVSG